jgi:hypothetical protein
VRGRQRVALVPAGRRLEEAPVRLEEPDGEEERLGQAALERAHGQRRDGGDVVGLDVVEAVVAEHVGRLGDVLLADELGEVARLAQRVDEVLAVVAQLPAAVGQAGHPVHVRVAAGDEGGPAARARRGGRERAAEEDPLLGEALDGRRRHGVAVGLDVAARVV